jgi:hypothetical protein
MYVVTFAVYGSFSAIFGLEPPAEVSPGRFLLSVLVVKLGLSVAFVLLFLGLQTRAKMWLRYSFIWWLMFVFGEIGQAIGPGYSWTEAAAGIIAETIYCPLSAFAAARVLRGSDLPDDSTRLFASAGDRRRPQREETRNS